MQPLSGMMGHAAAWGDLNQDRLPDLFVAGFCDRPNSEYKPASRPVPAKLFQNTGSGKFQVVQKPVTEFCGRSSAALFADLNNDGYPELIVANNTLPRSKQTAAPQAQSQLLPTKLFHNLHSKLIDISQAIPFVEAVRIIGAMDFNGDQMLDLLIVRDRFKQKQSFSSSALLKNRGSFKFQDVTAEAGLPRDLYGLGVAIADLNNDSRPDFFVSHSNRLFLSTPGNKYQEAIALNRVFQWDPLDKEDWPAGVAFGDLNNDARLDLVITAHHDPARNRIYINQGIKNGIPQFQDVTIAAGFGENIPAKSPHVEIQDFDNDGWMDIYVSAAWKRQGSILPVIYRNQGPDKNGIPHFSASHPMKPPMIYFPSGPTSDFNLDGRVDLFLVNWFSGETSHLLVNRTKAGNWLQVKAPMGTKIRVTAAGKIIGYQQVYTGYGFASGQSPICHFGVGKLRQVNLEIVLPDGNVKKSERVAVNQRLDF